ncbi:MAG: glycosyltransferase [Deltaproteobacteria bacterium]|nr:glycosyltransferase [Deltaproteobacteria bacterium]
MSQAQIDLSVIVPAYNEAERLPSTLRRLHQYFAGRAFTYEIIVVLDGPSDNTRDVLFELNGTIANLRIIDRGVNRGKGYAVREGMLNALGLIRLFSDADNSTDIVHFDQMKLVFEKGCDLVIASRNPKDVAEAVQAVSQAYYKRLMGRGGNAIVQLLAVPGLWDTQCGFKAFRADAAEQIFSRTTIDGWGFDIEVLVLARALKYRIGIIPANWINDDRSHFRLLDYLRVLGETVKVRYNLITRKYDL